jgi:two-component system phosphate regulon sensor histidine kinase PhoR
MSAAPVRILVVDDEYGIRESCRKVLTYEGYDVVTARDGAEGLEMFKANGDFAAALVDLKMPRMGGIELVEQLRALDEYVVLLIITAYASIETAVEATKRGAFGYVTKPFTPAELLIPVRRGLEMRKLALDAKRLRQERQARLLEAARERSQSSTIIHCLSDALLVVNLEQEVVLLNEATRAVLAGLSGKRPPFALDELDCEPLRHLLAETIKGPAGPRIVSKEIALDRRTYMVNASPVTQPDGGVIGGVALLRDISELKSIETAKSMFVSMVAHELKNPLSAIEGYLKLIVDGDAGERLEQFRDSLERVLLRARTLRELVSDLMTLQGIETGRIEISRVLMDLTAVLTECVRVGREKASLKHIEIRFDPPDIGKETVLADRNAMFSVFSNLIDNAVKYTPDSGQVTVGLEARGDQTAVIVEDTGIGIATEHQQAVFDEFFRVRNRHTAAIPGTGLGLCVVKHFVELHHGRILLQSTPGKGSRFTVLLPTATASLAALPAGTKVGEPHPLTGN